MQEQNFTPHQSKLGTGHIKIYNAKAHNLKNISLGIPKNKLVVICGVSGSGKSSLAFDTIYAEGQRRYVESLSSYARQFLGVMDKPDVEKIEGLSPAIAIDQSRHSSFNPRSTVGTMTEIYDYLRLLFACIGKPHCPQCGKVVKKQSAAQITQQIFEIAKTSEVLILAPIIRGKKGQHQDILKEIQRAGFFKVRLGGEILSIDEALDLSFDKQKKHTIEVIIDKIPSFAPHRWLGASEGLFSFRKKENKKEKEAFRVKKEKIKRLLKEEKNRLFESVETALKLGRGILMAHLKKRKEEKGEVDILFSELFACSECNISIEEIEPRIFSFNSPFGACPKCQGLGAQKIFEPTLILNEDLTLNQGAILPWQGLGRFTRRAMAIGWHHWTLEEAARTHHFSLNAPFKKLSDEEKKIVLYGDKNTEIALTYEGWQGKTHWEGVMPLLERRYKETNSDFLRQELEKYIVVKKCPACWGRRLKAAALAVKIQDIGPAKEEFSGGLVSLRSGLNIADVSAMSIIKSKNFFQGLSAKLQGEDFKVAGPIIKEILKRLDFLIDVGLDYLTLEREAATLSGGENQRIRLATQLGSGLSGVIYILDEPSIGLHQRDIARLITTLKKLRDYGNTVIIVEHDPQTIMSADWAIDIGPGAGEEGGKIIFEGTPQELLKKHTLTGDYLSGRKKILVNRFTASPPVSSYGKVKTDNKTDGDVVKQKTNYLVIRGAAEHNLKNIDVKIPLGNFVCVTGVSGSGKSTLVNETLAKTLLRHFYRAKEEPGKHQEILGLEFLDKIVLVDQSPIGRTPRSNPATYCGIFSHIRNLFATLPEAKIRGYKPGRFSFNVKGGRCESCQGEGLKKIEMYFMPDLYVECEECQGKRYNQETLAIKYKSLDIAQVLNLNVKKAEQIFRNFPALRRKIQTLNDVGLDYIKLGQSATTLSGGEAQRIKLAFELSKVSSGKTLYILDEPTIGLHFADIDKLLAVLHSLAAAGNTILVIEHNLDVIKTADFIIDLGPEGGEKGGEIVACGAPKEITRNKKSLTGQFLRSVL